MVIWGVSWASAKMITNYTNLEVILFWRLLVTFISLIPVLWITKDSWSLRDYIKSNYQFLFGCPVI
jgi:drug/metabolite transporter (DMT)-like permease